MVSDPPVVALQLNTVQEHINNRNVTNKKTISGYMFIVCRDVPIWEFWVLPIPVIFLSESTDTDHQTDIDLAHVNNDSLHIPCI